MIEPAFDHERHDTKPNRWRKSDSKRIASMLTRLNQPVQNAAERPIEYEYEYRGAEYEHEARRIENA